MTQRETAGVAIEIVERIDAGLRGPVEIQLHRNEPGIRPIENHVHGPLPFELNELEVVIVPGELHTVVAASLPEARDQVDVAAVVVQRGALIGRQPAQRDVAVPQRL